mmetsp:Transcript_67933/g.189725  ORF Transcript_67933/g.189725 Transcript_67933/m.189725 type:complete len:259 (-) Transcript_67933:469-1245(-)
MSLARRRATAALPEARQPSAWRACWSTTHPAISSRSRRSRCMRVQAAEPFEGAPSARQSAAAICSTPLAAFQAAVDSVPPHRASPLSARASEQPATPTRSCRRLFNCSIFVSSLFFVGIPGVCGLANSPLTPALSTEMPYLSTAATSWFKCRMSPWRSRSKSACICTRSSSSRLRRCCKSWSSWSLDWICHSYWARTWQSCWGSSMVWPRSSAGAAAARECRGPSKPWGCNAGCASGGPTAPPSPARGPCGAAQGGPW